MKNTSYTLNEIDPEPWQVLLLGIIVSAGSA
jgi:hypothetical protein